MKKQQEQPERQVVREASGHTSANPFTPSTKFEKITQNISNPFHEKHRQHQAERLHNSTLQNDEHVKAHSYTPDSWIKSRSDQLIRLTGPHPFNAEPSSHSLVDAGLVTPTHLHYVRNHGSVPKLDWNSHLLTMSFDNAASASTIQQQNKAEQKKDQQQQKPNQRDDKKQSDSQPTAKAQTTDEHKAPTPTAMEDSTPSLQLSMDDLFIKCKFGPLHTVMATLTCDGNRRKELNLIRHSKGFNWGPGATACSEWTGVKLASVLKYFIQSSTSSITASSSSEVEKSIIEKYKYVCFEGSDKEELPNRSIYGTSIPLETALDERNDILLAFKMNGTELTPDHGYPIRLVIPGYVGGRNVKWLTKIELSPNESKSKYHYEDNRVLPPSVDLGMADSGSPWWHKPEYCLYEMNVNSVITHPRNNDWVTVFNEQQSTADSLVEFRGYAYSGGGRAISRVELSLNEGTDWLLCELHFPGSNASDSDKRSTAATANINTKYCWTWCHWSLKVPLWPHLIRASTIVVRAWDSSYNTQPKDYTWNVLGMMNNAWYRLKLEIFECNGHEKPQQHARQQLSRQEPTAPDAYKKEATLKAQEERSSYKAQEETKQAAPIRDEKKAQADSRATSASDNRKALLQIQFLHPTLPGHIKSGGYMHNNGNGDSHKRHMIPPFISYSVDRYRRAFSWQEIQKHNRPNDCWIVIDGAVYDVSTYGSEHPGGIHSLVLQGGKDASSLFYDIHASDAAEIKEHYCIGMVDNTTSTSSLASKSSKQHIDATMGGILRAERWNTFELVKKENLTPNTVKFTFSYVEKEKRPSKAAVEQEEAAEPRQELQREQQGCKKQKQKQQEEQQCEEEAVREVTRPKTITRTKHRLGLPIGQHILVGANIGDHYVVRPYTPIAPVTLVQEEGDQDHENDEDKDSIEDTNGQFELAVKIYRANEIPHFPQGGIMSQFLDKMRVNQGDTVMVKGPAGPIEYHGNGVIAVHGMSRKVSVINMIAGGTGITPMFQLLRAILKANKKQHMKNDRERSGKQKEQQLTSSSRRGEGGDQTRVNLLYASHSIEDIILFKELRELEQQFSNDQINIHYVLDSVKFDQVEQESADKRRGGGSDQQAKGNDSQLREGREWLRNNRHAYSEGRINEALIRQYCSPVDTQTSPSSSGAAGNIVLLCGPPALVEHVCVPALLRIGYADDEIVEF